MGLSEQFWLSLLVEIITAVAIISMMKQQLHDLIAWVRDLGAEVKELQAQNKDHEGRISHVEGRLNIPRESK